MLLAGAINHETRSSAMQRNHFFRYLSGRGIRRGAYAYPSGGGMARATRTFPTVCRGARKRTAMARMGEQSSELFISALTLTASSFTMANVPIANY